MEFGVHLPLIAFRGQAFSLSRLVDYAETAEQLGFTTVCANDHLTFSRPWLDSLTALASIRTKMRQITLMTTVALPVVRGPVMLAKSLAALDVLSGGRLIAGVGPGSLPQDYALVGIAFEERWKRFDEVIQLLRRLLQRNTPPFKGQFYVEASAPLEPFPTQEPGRSLGGWLARFRLPRHSSVVRRRIGPTAPVSASSW
jgi:alkanesulfonate monooxygenase SsuD/methylene tetrahydromethanopterin reductase-like flavin-dependent oxidoreductase (luciferase family)